MCWMRRNTKKTVCMVEDVDMTLSFSVYEGDATTKETYEKEGKYTGQLVDGVPDGRCV